MNTPPFLAQKTFFLSLSFLTLCSLILLPTSLKADEGKRSILYLNSYHDGYRWSDTILEGIRHGLEQSSYKVDLQIEYMDAKKYNVEPVIQQLLRLYQEKFHDKNFDVVIASDDDAFNFAQRYRDMLFPDIPLVFCGVNDLSTDELKAGNLTGVVENFNLSGTIDVALKLHPGKTRMVVVGDISTTGNAIKHQIEELIPAYRDRLDVEYWIQLDLDEVQRRVEQLGDDTFLFFIPYYQVIGDQFYKAEEVIQEIYLHSPVPIYSCWEFLLGSGLMGGSLLSGFEHGRSTALMALDILDGKEADRIPVNYVPVSIYRFDYKVMQRLKISQKLLPEGSELINAPSSFYSLPRELFWTIIVSCVLLFITVLFLAVNMVAKKRVERKMKEQLTFQETLIDTIPQLVSWKDTQRHYVGANRTFANFFGLDEISQVVGKSTEVVVADKKYVQWSTSADEAVATGHEEVRKVRREIIASNGEICWLEVNKVPLHNEQGKITGILTTAENVTREHNLEKQLLQSQKMKAIGTLAGGIAHDFNNILTSIINSTELAVSDIEPDSQTGKDLARVLKAAKRGSRVVKQILAFSKPTKEGFRSTDLAAVISEVIHLIEVSLPGNIVVRSYIAPGIPPISADPTQIHQAVMNLFTNAYHALKPSGGEIKVRLEEVHLDQEKSAYINLEEGDYLRITVSDNGPGIPDEIIDKIFDPFFTMKDKSEGTGLGLTVVHGIVKGHGGGLQVKSEYGQGATFELFLPKIELSAPAPLPDAQASSGIHGRILFVEDDLDQLQTAPRLLEKHGYTVSAVAHAREAISMMKEQPDQFDLLVTDYDLPEIDGVTLIKILQGYAPSLPVIIISGREEAFSAANGLSMVRRILVKPYDKDELTTLIDQILQGRGN